MFPGFCAWWLFGMLLVQNEMSLIVGWLFLAGNKENR